jgi:hypothetical protein
MENRRFLRGLGSKAAVSENGKNRVGGGNGFAAWSVEAFPPPKAKKIYCFELETRNCMTAAKPMSAAQRAILKRGFIPRFKIEKRQRARDVRSSGKGVRGTALNRRADGERGCVSRLLKRKN